MPKNSLYRTKRTGHRSEGFTLIEVLVALLIFAISFSTFLGILTASLSATARNRDKQEAVFAARKLLAFVEGTDEPLKNVSTTGSLNDVSEVLSQGVVQFDEVQNRKYTVTLDIGFWKMQDMDNDALKKISLTISWGSDGNQSINVIYFIPNNE